MDRKGAATALIGVAVRAVEAQTASEQFWSMNIDPIERTVAFDGVRLCTMRAWFRGNTLSEKNPRIFFVVEQGSEAHGNTHSTSSLNAVLLGIV